MGDAHRLHTVLVANRGEIAVRVIRACRDAGLNSVAVYSDADRDMPQVRLADQAFALNGETPAETYLNTTKILDVARRSGANGVHPGYGFLSENADCAQAVLDAGLIWIGPPPRAIRVLGDKVTARGIARRVGAPLIAGSDGPVADADEVLAFVERHGLPVVIKAAFGGGGRGIRVVRDRERVPELFDAAVREAEAAFGRGESFVERYLDRPRHVEAQVLADGHDHCIVVGTRDCSLQRRHQKLVEEAPAPFLDDAQRERIHTAARDICLAAGYVGAGTVEFLVGTDGTISFLEVNTRLQVEHPVTEETTGIDLVLEQFRIADGEILRFTTDPTPRGHSIEFRLNAEDPGRDFLPSPGTVTRLVVPGGPGVRLDMGTEAGGLLNSRFDSMIGKLIVTGEDRPQAIARAGRAFAELVCEGPPTVIPFHRAVIEDPAFTAPGGRGSFTVHTRWIESEFDNRIQPHPDTERDENPAAARQSIVVEVGGRRLEVSLPRHLVVAGDGAEPTARSRRRSRARVSAATGNTVSAPMQGTVVTVAVGDGDRVGSGDLIAVIEAMKMENPVYAHRDGTVTSLAVAPGAAVGRSAVLCEISD